MNTSSKRSAVAAALILSTGVLAGCGGDDADASAEATPTPAWESTRGAAPTNADAPTDETPPATEADAGAEEPQAAPEQPVADGGDAPADPPADGGDGGGDAAGPPADSGDGGGQQPQPDPGGDDDPPPVAQPIDACALGAEAIAGLLGANPAPEDTSDAEEFGPGCFWTGAAGDELVLNVSTFDDWISAADQLGGGTENVGDLGTEAWASLSASSNLQIAWRRDDVSVALSASLGSGGAQLVDVARAIDAALQAAGY
ncbi:hypothetical protein [Jiangella endophytica]|uniref:hypothetical protein n=1 Tax=Jiangella endophytica TaxID=1623398 RepID=UPI000E34E3D4|nr:hypothetical protein [Jiangella endophytica]